MNISTNIQKIKYLRLLTEALKGGWEYIDDVKCPCGHLAKVVTGLSPEELEIKLMDGHHCGVWTESLGICPATGRPFVEVVANLFDAGFTANEIEELEDSALNATCAEKPEHVTFFIQDWRTRLITETETQLTNLSADLQVEKLLIELTKEKEAV